MYIEPWDLDALECAPSDWDPESFVAQLEDFESLADYADGQPGVEDFEYTGPSFLVWTPWDAWSWYSGQMVLAGDTSRVYFGNGA